MSYLKKLLFVWHCVGCVSVVFSKDIPPLEREVTLAIKQKKVESILSQIETQAKVRFAYPAELFLLNSPLSIDIKQKTVREALTMVLPSTVYYVVKSNYIVLKNKPLNVEKKNSPITGYVYDGSSNKKLSHVTIYDKNTLQSATTNKYGYYSFPVHPKNDTILIRKDAYMHELVKIDSTKQNGLLIISLNPLSDSVSKKDSVKQHSTFYAVAKSYRIFSRNFRGYINSLNVNDTINRNFQISFLPFIGSNHKLSGSVVNKVSVNILGGYSKGITKFEVGGLFNLNRNHVKGLQIAGLTNLVGGNTEGIQLAGIFNGTYNNFKGVDIAGISNCIGDTANGVFISGIANVLHKSEKSTELAGLVNVSQHVNESMQVAGIVNYAAHGKVTLQLSTLYNRAHINNGLQIGVVNYADSASGISIGFLSIVKKGLHQLEVASDEVMYANLSFRTGTYKFFNVVNLGCAPGYFKEMKWSLGYGVGTSFKVSEKLKSDITLTHNHINKGKFLTGIIDLYKLYWGIETKIYRKINLCLGPTFNLYAADTTIPDYESIPPYSLFKQTADDNILLTGWIGAKIGFRFF